jgi:alpha-L-fucosidase
MEMIMKKMGVLTMVAFATLLMIGCATNKNAEAVYEPTWESLSKHDAAPEWMQDAKLGIYFHWGPYTVPAYRTEWYPRWMWYDSEVFGPFNCTDVFEHHKKEWGHPRDFAYHEFVPLFNGKQFDPEEWAELFKNSGAKFAGPVAEHHDGFSMWDSRITPWNAKDRGPKRDVLGELFQSLEKRDIKRIATFHHARNFQRFNEESYLAELDKFAENDPRAYSRRSHFPYLPGHATVSDDPELQLMYGNMPFEKWHEEIWLGKLKEVIDNYQPDIIWFDSWLDEIPESYRQRFCAYYLNEAAKRDREVVIIRKQEDLPVNFTMNDHEKSREPDVLPELWMTDDTLSTDSWSYTRNMEIKPLDMVLHGLIDTVSKNGVVLLNISPTAAGVIPDDQREVLLGLGAWLERNGEAIYATRPWVVAAEGPSAAPPAGLQNKDYFLNLKYTHKDIRYTVSKDEKTVNAIALGVAPKGSEVVLTAFKSLSGTVKSVTDISGKELKWKMTNQGLSINMPESKEEHAAVFVIKLGSES